jgi:hypothetical protein
MSNFKSFALALAVGAASLGAAASAGAADADTITKESVHINNQDLSSEEGVQKVYRQIRASAQPPAGKMRSPEPSHLYITGGLQKLRQRRGNPSKSVQFRDQRAGPFTVRCSLTP